MVIQKQKKTVSEKPRYDSPFESKEDSIEGEYYSQVEAPYEREMENRNYEASLCNSD